MASSSLFYVNSGYVDPGLTVCNQREPRVTARSPFSPSSPVSDPCQNCGAISRDRKRSSFKSSPVCEPSKQVARISVVPNAHRSHGHSNTGHKARTSRAAKTVGAVDTSNEPKHHPQSPSAEKQHQHQHHQHQHVEERKEDKEQQQRQQSRQRPEQQRQQQQGFDAGLPSLPNFAQLMSFLNQTTNRRFQSDGRAEGMMRCAREYRDVNVKKSAEFWDYESLQIQWG